MKTRESRGFTLIELLTVISIIVILMGLVISVAGFVQDKASRDRSSAEIAAFSAAMESYKADNGIYPQDETTTDVLDPRVDKSVPGSKHAAATLFLYKELSGDTDGNFTRSGAERDNKVYFEFETKKSMVKMDGSKNVLGLMDPWGNYYGYSTAYAAGLQEDPPVTDKGYNPTFDLWSTANDKDGNEEKWIKNW